jgi:hydroxymethylbilane synthase
MLPAPGQGALGIQSRQDDPETARYLTVLDDHLTRAAVTAERAFLAGLGGGCSLPVAALAQADANRLHLQALVASPDGHRLIRLGDQAPIEAAQSLGQQLAEQALGRGAKELLS